MFQYKLTQYTIEWGEKIHSCSNLEMCELGLLEKPPLNNHI